MMPKSGEKISFVFPVHNEEGNIPALYEEVRDNCIKSGVSYEMIFVDDGSSDDSLGAIKSLREKDRSVRYISLSRSFGHQGALFAGMREAIGDAVITMDADLQHPPSLIPKMVEAWRNGSQVVYTIKVNSKLPILRRIIVKFSYWLISKLSNIKLSFGQSDFRLLDKQVLKILVELPEYHKFLRGQVGWIGFKQTGLTYDVRERHSGRAKYTYKKLTSLALDGIFAFSRYPLHLIMLFGLVVSGISFLYMFSVLMVWILKIFGVADIAMPPGWTTLAMAVFFLGSVQILSLGIIGEYVGRIYDQTKNRPVFIVKEKSEPEDKA